MFRTRRQSAGPIRAGTTRAFPSTRVASLPPWREAPAYVWPIVAGDGYTYQGSPTVVRARRPGNAIAPGRNEFVRYAASTRPRDIANRADVGSGPAQTLVDAR